MIYRTKKITVRLTDKEYAKLLTPEHFISLIAVQTDCGVQYKNLSPEQTPKAEFSLCEGETVEAVYAYCNLHGLWKA